MIELVDIVGIQAFHPGIANWRGQSMKGAYDLAAQFLFHQRINTKQADQPVVQDQLVAKTVFLEAFGFMLCHSRLLPHHLSYG